MTEAEWLTCDDPLPMLEFLRDKVSDRKLMYFALNCCRRIWHLLADKQGRRWVECAEMFADCAITLEELVEASQEWYSVGRSGLAPSALAVTAAHSATCPERIGRSDYSWYAHENADFGSKWAAIAASGLTLSGYDVNDQHPYCPAWVAERRAQACLLQDIFGLLPFRRTILHSAWRTANVIDLARAIYADRAFDRLPILADAFEDAGCTNRDILDHCRQPGEHARGCWVVDLLLGKS